MRRTQPACCRGDALNRPGPAGEPRELLRVDVYFDPGNAGPPILAGQLSRHPSRTGDRLYFEYSAGWLADADGFALDEALPLVAGQLLMAGPDGLQDLAPAFSDCSPDRWGEKLLDQLEIRRARAAGRPVRSLRAWDYLLGASDPGRMGALRFMDADTGRWLHDDAMPAPTEAGLAQLADVASTVDADCAMRPDEGQHLAGLVAAGAVLGGARPKAGFTDDQGRLWIAKFPGAEDTYDVGRWEYITWQLAGLAGIAVPAARLLPLTARRATFAVQRFDRSDLGRIHYASAWALLGARRDQDYSYADIACAIEQYGHGARVDADLAQLFRRVAFNVMVASRDDHLRNHGFLRHGAGWALSPAFDVNPNPHKAGHVLQVAGSGAGTAQLVADCKTYRLDQAAAVGIVEQVRDAVVNWRTVAQRAGAAGSEIAMMGGVIDSAR